MASPPDYRWTRGGASESPRFQRRQRPRRERQRARPVVPCRRGVAMAKSSATLREVGRAIRDKDGRAAPSEPCPSSRAAWDDKQSTAAATDRDRAFSVQLPCSLTNYAGSILRNYRRSSRRQAAQTDLVGIFTRVRVGSSADPAHLSTDRRILRALAVQTRGRRSHPRVRYSTTSAGISGSTAWRHRPLRRRAWSAGLSRQWRAVRSR